MVSMGDGGWVADGHCPSVQGRVTAAGFECPTWKGVTQSTRSWAAVWARAGPWVPVLGTAADLSLYL